MTAAYERRTFQPPRGFRGIFSSVTQISSQSVSRARRAGVEKSRVFSVRHSPGPALPAQCSAAHSSLDAGTGRS